MSKKSEPQIFGSDESEKSSDEGSVDEVSVNNELSDDEHEDHVDVIDEHKELKTTKEDDDIDGVEEVDEGTDDESNDFDEETNQDTSCIYNIKIKSNKAKKQIELDDDIIQDDEPQTFLHGVVKSEDRITRPYMTKYERVRILGVRCKQLILGAKPLIKKYTQLSPREIADLELKHGVIPFVIIRELPSGLQEHWKVNELTILN